MIFDFKVWLSIENLIRSLIRKKNLLDYLAVMPRMRSSTPVTQRTTQKQFIILECVDTLCCCYCHIVANFFLMINKFAFSTRLWLLNSLKIISSISAKKTKSWKTSAMLNKFRFKVNCIAIWKESWKRNPETLPNYAEKSNSPSIQFEFH